MKRRRFCCILLLTGLLLLLTACHEEIGLDITIENAKFPLSHGEITCEYQYGISNEPLPGQTAMVSVGEGRLLLVKVR